MSAPTVQRSTYRVDVYLVSGLGTMQLLDVSTLTGDVIRVWKFDVEAHDRSTAKARAVGKALARLRVEPAPAGSFVALAYGTPVVH